MTVFVNHGIVEGRQSETLSRTINNADRYHCPLDNGCSIGARFLVYAVYNLSAVCLVLSGRKDNATLGMGMKKIDLQKHAQRKLGRAAKKSLVELLVNPRNGSKPTDWWEEGSKAEKPEFLKRQAE